ncbi:MAG TPA: hypothetical protein H9999_08635, partial [Candidatus Negativibacillus faecipullorum]|nr:hypothetical protein [Candidatus Negativibacillus faecipullorum]
MQAKRSTTRAIFLHRRIPKGGSPWRFFGDFLIGEKVTRGLGRSAQKVGAGTTVPQNSPGVWGTAPKSGNGFRQRKKKGVFLMLTFILSRGVPTPKYSTNGIFEFD